jgi:hypothetical protein
MQDRVETALGTREMSGAAARRRLIDPFGRALSDMRVSGSVRGALRGGY